MLFDQLKAQGLASGESKLTSFASPRRLAAHVTVVAAQAADKAVSQKLMPVSVGLDASGNATPALLKKLQSLGADASAVPGLKRAMDGKAEALFHDSTVKGATLAEGLQKALNESLAKLPIPKVMTYQLGRRLERREVRAPGACAGGAAWQRGGAGRSAGPEGRATSRTAIASRRPPTRCVLKDADSYASTLENDGAVIASFEARRAEIVRQLADAAAKVGGGPRRSKTKPCSMKSPRWSSAPMCWSASSRRSSSKCRRSA